MLADCDEAASALQSRWGDRDLPLDGSHEWVGGCCCADRTRDVPCRQARTPAPPHLLNRSQQPWWRPHTALRFRQGRLPPVLPAAPVRLGVSGSRTACWPASSQHIPAPVFHTRTHTRTYAKVSWLLCWLSQRPGRAQDSSLCKHGWRARAHTCITYIHTHLWQLAVRQAVAAGFSTPLCDVVGCDGAVADVHQSCQGRVRAACGARV